MKDIKELIERIDAVSTNTAHAKIEALEKINLFAPRIQDIVKLVNHAGKNGIAVETLCKPKADMPGNSFAVRDSYLVYRNGDCTNNLTDDECYYIDYNGWVFTSTYAGKQDGFIFRFDSTFKIVAGFNSREEKNKRELDRLERIIAGFEKFEEHVYTYIENEVIKKEETNNG